MSDTSLRDLGRRWKKTGSVDDEAAYLLERVRVGDLSGERLELAAYCGHEGATAALKASGVTMIVPRDPGRWGGGLRVYDKVASVLALVAIARARLSDWELWSTADRRPLAAIQAAQTWLDCPCEPHATSASEASVRANEARQPLTSLSDVNQLRDRTPAGARRVQECQSAVRAAESAASAARAAASRDSRGASEALVGIGESTLVMARTAIVPWALAPRGSSP